MTCTPGVRTEPVGEGAGFPVVQDVDDPMTVLLIVQVDQDSRVGVPPLLGEIVHPKDGDQADLRIRQGPDQPDERGSGDFDAQHLGHSGSSPAGQCQRDRFQHAAQHRSSALMPLRETGHLLSEGVHLARRVGAEETTCLKVDRQGPATTGQVMKAALVAAVHPGRPHGTGATTRLRSLGSRDDQHTVFPVCDRVDVHVVEMRKEE
jgi:hypothetical protein